MGAPPAVHDQGAAGDGGGDRGAEVGDGLGDPGLTSGSGFAQASPEIAAAAVYLASDKAAYVTGQTLHVNGGMAMI